MYLVVEGIDGSFKSTIVNKLACMLNKANLETIPLRQPGGTEIAEALRSFVKDDSHKEEMTLYTESVLFLGARSELFFHKIEPALAKGTWVISDRCNLSTIAYQSYKGISADYISDLIESAPWFRKADVLIVIDVPASVAEKRIEKRGEPSDRLELRLNHCSEIYRNFDSKRLAKNTIRINGFDGDRELTSDEMTEIAYKKILELNAKNSL